MRPNLEEALAALIDEKSEAAPPPSNERTAPQPPPTRPTPGTPVTPDTALSPNERALVKTASEHLQRAEEAQQRGDWATYGQEMSKARKALEEVAK
jgi:uncharacterized membrane protein (UPF0182 family)